jgi:gliding motility-associated-like protein
MSRRISLYLSCLIMLIAGLQFRAEATHIVGGEVTYRYLGSNQYRIRIDIYQDCLTGDINAIREDDPAFITVFNGEGGVVRNETIPGDPSVDVPDNFSNECINNKPRTCLKRQTFQTTVTLAPSVSGYYIVYQRCCRNGTIRNIVDPGSVGATYYAVIPPGNPERPSSNNSAVFSNYPPQIICINNPLVYDHSARDVDGDSLSYEFCTAYTGGSPNNAKPQPNSIFFRSVNYQAPFNPTFPMSGAPALQIDARTGMITGTPNQLGRYVVTVCCHEWRNGILINTVTREFQFVVTNCSKVVVANIPQFSEEFNTYIVQCDGYKVRFSNLSSGANTAYDAYTWDFGVPGTDADTSHLQEPEFTYPDTGTYTVKLVVNRGSTCRDSITRLVKVYPSFNTDFEWNGKPCPRDPIQFVNKVTSTYQPVLIYSWDFGDGTTSTDPDPSHVYAVGGNYQVKLSAKNIKGCFDTAIREVPIERFIPFAGNDTIIVKGESIIFSARGGTSYTWTPATYLNNSTIPNPIGFYPDTGRIRYIVNIGSEGGCEGLDTINVWVVGQSAIFVPNAFTPDGDGRNDVLKPIGIGYRNMNYFRVFNRWGQMVFYTTRFDEGWDGTNQGARADMGTYFWVLSINDRNGKEEMLKGDAILIR